MVRHSRSAQCVGGTWVCKWQVGELLPDSCWVSMKKEMTLSLCEEETVSLIFKEVKFSDSHHREC